MAGTELGFGEKMIAKKVDALIDNVVALELRTSVSGVFDQMQDRAVRAAWFEKLNRRRVWIVGQARLDHSVHAGTRKVGSPA